MTYSKPDKKLHIIKGQKQNGQNLTATVFADEIPQIIAELKAGGYINIHDAETNIKY